MKYRLWLVIGLISILPVNSIVYAKEFASEKGKNNNKQTLQTQNTPGYNIGKIIGLKFITKTQEMDNKKVKD